MQFRMAHSPVTWIWTYQEASLYWSGIVYSSGDSGGGGAQVPLHVWAKPGICMYVIILEGYSVHTLQMHLSASCISSN